MAETNITRSEDEVLVDLPPMVFQRGGRGFLGWVIGYGVILLFVLPFWVRFLIGILSGGGDNLIGQLGLFGLSSLFVVASAYLLLKSFSIGRRHEQIRATQDELKAESQGFFRARRFRWARDEIDLIRKTHVELPVNGILLPALEIHALGASAVLGVQRNESELAEVCNVLGEQLGIETAASWKPGSPDRRPIPAPKKTDIEVDDAGSGRLGIGIPVPGKLSGLLSLIFGLGILAALIAMFVSYRLWVPANWNFQTVPPLQIAALVLIVVALWAVRRMLVAHFAPRLRIAVANGELSVIKPGPFGSKRSAWPREQIERVGVEFLFLSVDTIGHRAVLQIVVQTPKGTETLARLDKRLKRDRSGDYEFYWIADQIQRALAY